MNRNCFTKTANTPVYTFGRLAKISFVLTSSTLAHLSYKRWILCEKKPNRMSGYHVYNDEKIKFDWKRFWLYLRPHIWYIIGAIAVRKCNNS